MAILTPNTAQDAPLSHGAQVSAVPKIKSEAVNLKTGQLSQSFWRYVSSFSSNPAAENAVNLGVSPTVYTATRNGTLIIQGGTISAITLNSRTSNPPYSLPVGTTIVPISVGDVVTITYSIAPVVTFFPR